ncbi:hypothetical protein AFM11_11425 [Mycolicibacterium wolinskyi]|uniref:Uncharacterized protein n=1 Tax=Mycolicibacterium wolinskyi TaxID=59750 RepID=A0A132PNT4_9MYCO|nr:hypothetical protein [Mycolicibacterium wolinskyi]KWX23975.1 hypothetical protein AFM11_11425 [Mycolicibacterium wolinskyi]
MVSPFFEFDWCARLFRSNEFPGAGEQATLALVEQFAAVEGQDADKFDEPSIEPLCVHAESRQDIFVEWAAVRGPLDHIANDVPIEFIDALAGHQRFGLASTYGAVLKKTFFTSV